MNVRVTQYLLFSVVFCRLLFLPFVIFILFIVLSVLRRFTVPGHRRSWHGLTTPLFLTFCLQIYFQYNFFIIPSLFPYFNLFVSIFIQSYVNIKLHVSTLYRYRGLLVHFVSTVYRVDTCNFMLAQDCMNIDTNKLK